MSSSKSVALCFWAALALSVVPAVLHAGPKAMSTNGRPTATPWWRKVPSVGSKPAIGTVRRPGVKRLKVEPLKLRPVSGAGLQDAEGSSLWRWFPWVPGANHRGR